MDASPIPTAEEVRTALKPLTQRQLDKLGELSGVAVPTIAKIKYGQTENPGVDTVGKFWPFIAIAQSEAPRAA